MKPRHIFAVLFGVSAMLFGCSIDPPIDLGVRCGENNGGIAYIIYSNTACTEAQGEVCGRFANSFEYGFCPTGYFCIEDEAGKSICSVSTCPSTQHEFNGICELNSTFNCGQHGYICEDNTAGWVNGDCLSSYETATCIPSECEQGYDLKNGQCIALLTCPEGQHYSNGECEPDDLDNCGRHGYACKLNVAGWTDGTCTDGHCIPTSCAKGYELEDNTCAARVKCAEAQHIYDGECEYDSTSNCGMHGYTCADLEGWAEGNCLNSRCFATACVAGYELRPNAGTCREAKLVCEETEHIYNDTCEPNSIQNCGMHDNNCQKLSGWSDGACSGGRCIATLCENGYNLSDGQCVALINCDEGKHIFDGDCEDDSLDHCGKHNNACAEISGWADGSCTDGACYATSCATGYQLQNGKCTALTSCAAGSHLYLGTCEEDDVNNCGMHGNACANTVGWKSGECTNGSCVPSECTVGYHLDKSLCVADNNDNCGATGQKCPPGKFCTGGSCSANCQSGEFACTANGVTSCVDPNTSHDFCGADATCTNYKTCAANQSCSGGSCVINSCSDGTQLCVVNGENSCINIKDKNALHCGACNYDCSAHPLSGATSTSCSNGKCQYKCNTNYKNCGSAETPNCILESNFNSDSNNCGTCGKKCASNEYCYEGSCVTSKCAASNQCLDSATGSCVSNSSQCGTQCINCNSANNAASGTCSNGKCTITTCATGYHLTSAGKCEVNSASACGPTSSVSITNCNTLTQVASAVCATDGTCVIKGCNTGYHLYNNTCEANSTTNCLAHSAKCGSYQSCNATYGCVCNSGYHMNGTTCVSNNTLCENGYTNVLHNGSTVRAYCIKSKDDLLKLYNGLKSNGGSPWPDDNTANAYVLMSNVDLGTQSSWAGIGPSTDNAFTGIFMGNGHSISGSLSCSDTYCGLFGYLKSATIENLNSQASVTSSKALAGGLAGGAEGSSIMNIFVSGDVTSSSDGTVGGLIGKSSKNNIQNINTSGNVLCKTKTCGGLIGSDANSTINTAQTSGNVTGDSILGGLIGSAEKTNITYASASGIIKGTTNSIGGLIGSASNSYSLYYSNSASYIVCEGNCGGLVGASDNGTIKNSYYNGFISGRDSVGGIAGMTNGTTISLSHALGDFSGEYDIGGIVGYNNGANMTTIDRCAVFAQVESHGGNVGGIVGQSTSKLSINDCFVSTDLYEADKGGLIATAASGSSTTVSNVVALGSFNNITEAITDIAPTSGSINPSITKFYTTNEIDHSATNCISCSSSTYIQFKYNKLYHNSSGKELISVLGTNWSEQHCKPPFGLEYSSYTLPLPASMPNISICYK